MMKFVLLMVLFSNPAKIIPYQELGLTSWQAACMGMCLVRRDHMNRYLEWFLGPETHVTVYRVEGKDRAQRYDACFRVGDQRPD